MRVVLRNAVQRKTTRASDETPIVVLKSDSPEAVTCSFLVRRRLMALMVTNVEVLMPGDDEEDSPDEVLRQFTPKLYQNLRCIVAQPLRGHTLRTSWDTP